MYLKRLFFSRSSRIKRARVNQVTLLKKRQHLRCRTCVRHTFKTEYRQSCKLMSMKQIRHTSSCRKQRRNKTSKGETMSVRVWRSNFSKLFKNLDPRWTESRNVSVPGTKFRNGVKPVSGNVRRNVFWKGP